MWKIFLLMFVAGVSQANSQTAQTAVSFDNKGAPTRNDAPSVNTNEPSYQGKPLSYWVKSLRNRDDHMSTAFEAVRILGPAASAAVPELTRIVSEPVIPIEVGVDGYGTASAKLRQIQLHSHAVDCLRAIGMPAASSAKALTQWALAERVVAGNFRDEEDRGVFINIVGIDVVERIRVAGAVAEFLPDSSMVVAELLKSKDEEAVKHGVAILSERSLPIATELLKSRNCTDEKLGLKMLADLWPVVAKDHLLDLRDTLPCTQSERP
jgi:hypothetical protein